MTNLISPAPGDRIAADHLDQFTTLLNAALGLTVRSQTALGRIELPSMASNPSSPSNYQMWIRSDQGQGRMYMRGNNGQNIPMLALRQRVAATLSTTTFTTNSSSLTDITNATLSITPTGGRLRIYLIPEEGQIAEIYTTNSLGVPSTAQIKCLVAAVDVGTHYMNCINSYQQGDGATNVSGPVGGQLISSLCWEYLPPTPGVAYTVKLQCVVNSSSGTNLLAFLYARLVVVEYADA